MTNSLPKNVPDVGVKLGVTCISRDLTPNSATAPGYVTSLEQVYVISACSCQLPSDIGLHNLQCPKALKGKLK